MEYGLVGYPLKHSFSKQIHNKIGNLDYDLFEIERDKFEQFIKNKNFKGLNVTIPFKEEVIKYLDCLDGFASDIKAVNTIKNKNGKLYGYNTDILGFNELLKKFGISVDNKNVLILGTGGTSKTIFYAVKNRAKSVLKVSRSSKSTENIISYDDIYKFEGTTDVIINTTPNGMFPHIYDDILIDLEKFDKLTAVIDVIYNPLRTKLISKATELNIVSVNGLYMLIAQAVFANEIFKNDTEIDFKKINLIEKIDEIYEFFLSNLQNIVLIGMPSCGKTTISKLISEKYNYNLIDIDAEIEKRIGKKISIFIEEFGESEFRKIEKEVVAEVSKSTNSVIATGGGVILNRENIDNLKMNGKIYYIERDLEKLTPTADRPLTKDFNSLKIQYEKRVKLYEEYCDVKIDGNGDLENIAEIIYAKHS